ncbi:hypothetical protein GCM10009801_36110 [Streptomyces albiaxialis]|uniref:Uncharacterized protein n=1 Tax=Streptomyces albiaxialis TaxID=329523 RepID=A0ABN2VZZ2_9ACTN
MEKPAFQSTEPESLEQLLGDCAQMTPHWVVTPPPGRAPVPPRALHGVQVPRRSARLLDGMSEYGD